MQITTILMEVNRVRYLNTAGLQFPSWIRIIFRYRRTVAQNLQEWIKGLSMHDDDDICALAYL